MTEIEVRNRNQEISDFLEQMDDQRRKLFQDLINVPLPDKKSSDLDTLIDMEVSDKPIARTIALFESWREQESERKDLERIFRIAFQMDHPEATEEELTELIGFVGALRMLRQI